eukprot:366229-Chlamydomonas_euryale.AAC.63
MPFALVRAHDDPMRGCCPTARDAVAVPAHTSGKRGQRPEVTPRQAARRDELRHVHAVGEAFHKVLAHVHANVGAHQVAEPTDMHMHTQPGVSVEVVGV